MDETPIFWEYLPRKILTSTMSKCAFGWRRGYHNAQSTLILAANASGNMFPPSLVLKRKSPYYLQCENDIGFCLMNSSNGWNKGDLTIKWIEKILLPYVGR